MTLTTVIGSSGSGKTTFLNDVHKSHKCIYIRQYHNMRPYITVSKIPNFDPTALPYWDTYVKEGKASTIQVGGTMAGKFTAGLSGGQRKLLLFELICQRIRNQSNLLIVLDEPFSGVTDDFVPFIVERLQEIRENHNVVLVTNDHIDTLTDLADNTITVSTIDRNNVRINESTTSSHREKVISALSLGDNYIYESTADELKFFFDVEVYNNNDLSAVAIFTLFTFGLLLLTYWNSNESTAALVLIGASTVAFLCLQPLMNGLVDWRDVMREEAEALLHSSKGMNKVLKTLLTFTIVFIISIVEYGCINAVVSGFRPVKFWVAIFFDGLSIVFPQLILAIFTTFPSSIAIILGAIPFLLGIMFSSTFSPGGGAKGVKALRYMFSRFYFWCMVPGVKEQMDGCPADNVNLLYLVLSSFICFVFLLVMQIVIKIRKIMKKNKMQNKRESMMTNDKEFQELQLTLYGEKVLERLKKHEISIITLTNPNDIADLANDNDIVC